MFEILNVRCFCFQIYFWDTTLFLFTRRWNSYCKEDVFHHFVLYHTYFTASLISSMGFAYFLYQLLEINFVIDDIRISIYHLLGLCALGRSS